MPRSFPDLLRDETQALHLRAERSGVVRELISGRANRFGYVLLLRNLWLGYRELETRLERLGTAPGVRQVARAELYRSRALAADLEEISGPSWQRTLAQLPAGEAYARRIAAAAEREPFRLIGHAYVRFLGDLSGGQVLRRVLERSLGLGPAALSFYDFPSVPDLEAAKADFRAGLEAAAAEVGNREAVVDEAKAAFRYNIELSEAVQVARGSGS